MKRFIRSIGGKIILFILCFITIMTLTASIGGILFLTQSEWNSYSMSGDEYVNEWTGYVYRSHGSDLIWNHFGTADISKNFRWHYRISDQNNKVIAESDGFKDSGIAPFTVTYGTLSDPNGNLTDVFYHYADEALATNVVNLKYYTVSLSPFETSSDAPMVELLRLIVSTVYTLRYSLYIIALLCVILLIVFLAMLMYASGRRPDTEECSNGWVGKIPFDLLLLAIFGVASLLVAITFELGHLSLEWIIVWAIGLYIVGTITALLLLMFIASGIKNRTLIKNTVTFRLLKLIFKGLKAILSLFAKIPLIWKTALAVGVITFTEFLVFIAFDGRQDVIVAFELLLKLILIPLVLYIAITLRRLQKSGRELALGNLSYHTDTSGMLFDFKEHGENLNSIALGMSRAVDERLKSERMKTELITNVSHDIKTPLTSIINYAGLIGNETCDNPVITEYSGVLVRQSEKLKRLIEDLVEASKASTGNLEVELAPCDASIFISQSAGEYEEKLKENDLTLVTKEPDKEVRIMADGRRMWRIFDNLMNNICKYAQPGTRVYLSLEEYNDNAIITFKNTSKEPLDMTEEELMERFTRGDSSRNTEGNGLGLSIAKSMAELQNGRLKISTDADLFKAVLVFPVINETA